MSNLPLITIVTPSYNQGGFLEQTIRSVLDQDYQNIEYIVMDGGSTDNSPEILRRYADHLEYWESKADRGQAHGINKGLQRSKGEILGWLNSDDVLLPGTVNRIAAAFEKHPGVDVIYGRIERINEQGELIPTPLLPKDKVVFNKQLIVGECVVNQPGSFWRRRIMGKVGLLDESLMYALDYEYWIRLALSGAVFLRLPDVVAQFRLSSSSKTVGNTAMMAHEQLHVLNSVLARPNLSDELGLSEKQIQILARKTRSLIGLHASYGHMKLKHRRKAWHWIVFAIKSDPTVVFHQRWVVLAIAGSTRRIRSLIA
jgi:glycosyltransferase involved in cell wall biosynthesis